MAWHQKKYLDMGTGRSPPNRTATISTRNPNCLTHQLPHLGVTWRHPPDSSHSVAPRKLFPDVKDHRHPKNFPHLPQTGSLFPSCFTTNIYICVCVSICFHMFSQQIYLKPPRLRFRLRCPATAAAGPPGRWRRRRPGENWNRCPAWWPWWSWKMWFLT